MTEVAVSKVESNIPSEAQKPAAPQAPLEERIRIRAYELCLARNCEPGHADDDWFQAETELAEKPAGAPKDA